MERFVQEETRRTKLAAKTDVVVVGGGIAGVAAALSAARNGAKVILLEKQCALGGLATLGLVVIYLPLCDGYGRQLVGGIGEELIRLSMRAGLMNCPPESKYRRESIPECWLDPGATTEERKARRYRAIYEAAPMMLALEDLLIENGIDIWYDTHLCGARCENGVVRHVYVENKSGRLAIEASAFVDCSGDADLCHMAGEETVSSDQNRRSGWYYGADLAGDGVRLHAISDPLNGPCPPGSRFYRGDDGRDVSQYIVDMHRYIAAHNSELNEQAGAKQIPFLIPTMPLFRMTRRLKAARDITDADIGVWRDDALGMAGDWRKPAPGYSVGLSSLHGKKVGNLLAAGRCMGADGDAWDVFRAIPICAVTGEAAGAVAASLAVDGKTIDGVDVNAVKERLLRRNVIIHPSLLGK